MSEFARELRERIAPKWPTAEEFYNARDDRTRRVGGLDRLDFVNTPVEIHLDPTVAHESTVQRIVLTAANLTARWARRLRVAAGDAQVAPAIKREGDTSLTNRVAREVALANPFCDSTTYDGALRLFVGPWSGRSFAGDDYVIDAQFWTALGRRGGAGEHASNRASATTAAAGLAAALGAADLFKRAVGNDRSHWLQTFAWDTWSSSLRAGAEAGRDVVVRAVPETLFLGRVLLAGVGAIGSALVYLSDQMTADGHVTFLDRDAVDVTNLNRSPLFTVMDAFRETPKTNLAVEYLERRGMVTTDKRDGLWREHASSLSAEQFDIWISLTNEDGAWAALPFELPPVVLHGTTTSGWGFGVGRHIPRVEDCTLCRMPRPETEFRGPCAEGVIVPPSPEIEEVRASLPFLSTASAALILANLLQLQTGDPTVSELPNDVSADLQVGMPAIIALNRRSTAECGGCRALRTKTWITRGGRSRYARLSVFGGTR